MASVFEYGSVPIARFVASKTATGANTPAAERVSAVHQGLGKSWPHCVQTGRLAREQPKDFVVVQKVEYADEFRKWHDFSGIRSELNSSDVFTDCKEGLHNVGVGQPELETRLKHFRSPPHGLGPIKVGNR